MKNKIENKRGGAIASAVKTFTPFASALRALLLLALLLFALTIGSSVTLAQNGAPTYAQNTTAIASTTYFAGATNLATPILLDVRKQQNVALDVTLRGATTATNTFYLGWSDDGSTVTTNSADCPVAWQVDSASANSTTRTTNIATGGHGYLVVWGAFCTQQNTNSLKYSTKMSAP